MSRMMGHRIHCRYKRIMSRWFPFSVHHMALLIQQWRLVLNIANFWMLLLLLSAGGNRNATAECSATYLWWIIWCILQHHRAIQQWLSPTAVFCQIHTNWNSWILHNSSSLYIVMHFIQCIYIYFALHLLRDSLNIISLI